MLHKFPYHPAGDCYVDLSKVIAVHPHPNGEGSWISMRDEASMPVRVPPSEVAKAVEECYEKEKRAFASY